MITYLRGKLTEKNPTSIVVECGGVGYFLHISLNTFSKLPQDENIFIYTWLQVREDVQQLYGFMEQIEREIFLKLVSVSGIGPSTARTMLSSLSPEEIMEAITTEDVATIKSVKGIGVKTAQRLIIELKDKLSGVEGMSKILTPQSNTEREEALSALETLGYRRKQSAEVIRKILLENEGASAETIIKLALKKL